MDNNKSWMEFIDNLIKKKAADTEESLSPLKKGGEEMILSDYNLPGLPQMVKRNSIEQNLSMIKLESIKKEKKRLMRSQKLLLSRSGSKRNSISPSPFGSQKSIKGVVDTGKNEKGVD